MQHGLSHQQIGLLSSVGTLTALIAQPFWRSLSDRFGAEKRILMLCLLASAAVAFGYLFAEHRFMLLILTAMLYSFFAAAVIPLSDAITMNHATLHGQRYGSIRVLGSLSYALVMAPFGWLYQGLGIGAMFYVHLFFMGMVLIALYFVRISRKVHMQCRSLFAGIGVLFRHRMVVVFLITVFFMGIGHHFNNVFFAVYIGHLGGEVSQRIGILHAIAAFSELPFFLLSVYCLRRFGFYRLLAAVAMAAAVRWWVLSTEPAFFLLMLNQLLHGITFALFMAIAVTFVNQVSPEEFKNTGQSLFAVIYISLAQMLASNLGGYVIDYYGFTTLFRIGALLSFMSLAGVRWLASCAKRQAAEQKP